MLSTPILAIFRGIGIEHVQSLVKSCIDAGLDSIEVTMNTENASSIIEEFKQISGNRLQVGAGTVLSESDLANALSAGAEFIVTPVVNKNVIVTCRDKNIPVFPGALTPTEIWEAWQYGAEMVKVFPAGVFGPKYLKDLHGPLNEVKLMAVGGVNSETIVDYFKAGASAVAIGGSIFSKERLEKKQFNLITEDLKNLVAKISY
ncbi:MAG: bifunctional 4-hydroxy-2-oxoglutarate aldolase/2-dehydro-3-deoxy-phosphogluconate aldolase [Bacteroidales bacterium]|nr:bifunctional 4-hydroxy-2-oxoglutarate aldolase/2-dehydro-3-deoxy-phosphogluconate aldolase [Bacteroidales bacterium]MBN2821285.1 bifunctional 4-hydroxy-2-oxoglutarate aldolase/2-dehydro-3-deoxy-phosphogluconate aldolase [Bacteroidales bacterium]